MSSQRINLWIEARARELVHAAGALIAHGHPRGVGKVEDALRDAFERGAGVLDVADVAGDGAPDASELPPDLDSAIEVRFLEAPGSPDPGAANLSSGSEPGPDGPMPPPAGDAPARSPRRPR